MLALKPGSKMQLKRPVFGREPICRLSAAGGWQVEMGSSRNPAACAKKRKGHLVIVGITVWRFSLWSLPVFLVPSPFSLLCRTFPSCFPVADRWGITSHCVMLTNAGFCSCKDHLQFSFCLSIVISNIPMFKCCLMLSTCLKSQ